MFWKRPKNVHDSICALSKAIESCSSTDYTVRTGLVETMNLLIRTDERWRKPPHIAG